MVLFELGAAMAAFLGMVTFQGGGPHLVLLGAALSLPMVILGLLR